MEPDNLRRSWSVIRSAAGLPGVRFHDLRHGNVHHVSWDPASGINAELWTTDG